MDRIHVNLHGLFEHAPVTSLFLGNPSLGTSAINAIKVTSSLAGSGAGTIGELSDVDASNPQNGMILVYNSTTQKWTGTLECTPGASHNLDINGGSF